MSTLPAMGVYAKTNKVQWGIMNSIVVAGFLAYLKYAHLGKFYGDNVDKQKRMHISLMASHYNPN